MLHLDFRAAKRFALGSVLVALGVVGCTAGVQPTHLTGTGGGGGNAPGHWAAVDRHRPWRVQHRRQRRLDDRNGRHAAGSSRLRRRDQQPGRHRACDDGNTAAGDGCNGICHVEPNWTCPSAGACSRSSSCGDGKIDAGEVCDDSNKADGDGCNATCTIQDGRYVCMAGKPCVLSPRSAATSASSRARTATTATRRRTTAAARRASSSRAGSAWRPARRARRRAALRRRRRPGRAWARFATTATSPKATAARPTAR